MEIFFRDSHRTWQAQSVAIESFRNRTLEQPAVDESPTAVDRLPERARLNLPSLKAPE
jgi:hypothetical protein